MARRDHGPVPNPGSRPVPRTRDAGARGRGRAPRLARTDRAAPARSGDRRPLAARARRRVDRGDRADRRQLAPRRRVLSPIGPGATVPAALCRPSPRARAPSGGATPRPGRAPAHSRARLARPARVAERRWTLRGADGGRCDRLLRARGRARRDPPPPAALCAALPPGARVRRAPRAGALRHPGHDRARRPGGVRRRRPRATASTPPMARGGPRCARRRRGAGGMDRPALAGERLAGSEPRGRVAGRPAGRGRRRRAADVRASRGASRESPSRRVDRPLASARQRLRGHLSPRLRGGRHHAEHLPGPGGRRATPDDVRPLRGAVPRPAQRRGSGTGHCRTRASSPGRRASGRLRRRPDLRDRPRRAARVRRRGWCGRRPGPARARRGPSGRRIPARRSRRRS